jgi:hypothetical protein
LPIGGVTCSVGIWRAVEGLHDFDFLMGRWSVKSRRLKERLTGCWIMEYTRVVGDEGPPLPPPQQ